MKKRRNILALFAAFFLVAAACCFSLIFFLRYFSLSGLRIVQENAERAEMGVFAQKRSITVVNGITSEMLTYQHWSGSYAPSAFRLLIGQGIIPPQTTALAQLDEKGVL